MRKTNEPTRAWRRDVEKKKNKYIKLNTNHLLKYSKHIKYWGKRQDLIFDAMLWLWKSVSLLSFHKKSVEIISRFIVDDITKGKLALLIKFVIWHQTTVQIEIHSKVHCGVKTTQNSLRLKKKELKSIIFKWYSPDYLLGANHLRKKCVGVSHLTSFFA